MFYAIKKVILILGLGTLLLINTVHAEQQEVEVIVQQTVQNTIEQVLNDIKANRDAYLQNHEIFYESLKNNLASAVDIEGITKSIITVKYLKLANADQIKQFEETFKKSLLKFYGTSLLTIGDVEIRYLSSKINDKDANRAIVSTEAKASNGAIFPINYTMVKIDDSWLLRNVVVSGINVGKLFREQFSDQMKKTKNNFEQTIANWEQVVKAQQAQIDQDYKNKLSDADKNNQVKE